jgi:hypothetical protein
MLLLPLLSHCVEQFAAKITVVFDDKVWSRYQAQLHQFAAVVSCFLLYSLFQIPARKPKTHVI